MKRPPYPKYKETNVEWLGKVPEHWEVKRGRFAMRVNPPAPLLRSLEGDQEVSFVPMDAVNEYGGIRLDQTRVKAEVGGGYTEFQDGDVVIAKITPCFENGKGSIANGLVNSAAYGTTELHVLRATQALDCRFLFYLTITDGYRKLGESEMYGAGGQKRVPPEFCKDFLTPLPPFTEQAAIADFLDRETGLIDALAAKKQRLIELLKEKRTTLITRTVTRGLPGNVAREFGLAPHTRFKDSGIEWLGEIPEEWEIDRCKWSIRSVINGTWGSEPDEENDLVCIRVADFDRVAFRVIDEPSTVRAIEESQRGNRLLQKGDLLIEKSGGGEKQLVGCVVHYDLELEAVCSNFVARMPIASGMNSRFWAYVHAGMYAGRINYPSIKQTTGIQNLDSESYLNERVVYPPLPEQSAIAAYLDRETAKIDKLVEKIEAVVARLHEYRTALITAAVTGKVDVRAMDKG